MGVTAQQATSRFGSVSSAPHQDEGAPRLSRTKTRHWPWGLGGRHRESGSCVWGPGVFLARRPGRVLSGLQTLKGETLNSSGLLGPSVLPCYWRDMRGIRLK